MLMSEICGYEVIVITLMLTKQEYGSVQVLNFFLVAFYLLLTLSLHPHLLKQHSSAFSNLLYTYFRHGNIATLL